MRNKAPARIASTPGDQHLPQAIHQSSTAPAFPAQPNTFGTCAVRIRLFDELDAAADVQTRQVFEVQGARIEQHYLTLVTVDQAKATVAVEVGHNAVTHGRTS
jgi:hypothetical protein